MEVASILVVFAIRKEALTNWKGKVGIRNRRYLCRQAPWWHSIRCWKVIQRYSKYHIILYSRSDISLCRLVDLKPPGGWFEVLKDLDCATLLVQLPGKRNSATTLPPNNSDLKGKTIFKLPTPWNFKLTWIVHKGKMISKFPIPLEHQTDLHCPQG